MNQWDDSISDADLQQCMDLADGPHYLWDNSISDTDLQQCMALVERPPIPTQMLHLVQNNAREIKLSQLRAKIRLINTRRGRQMVEEIEEHFYVTEVWPAFALELVLGLTEFDYSGRMSMATFFHGNGLYDPNLAIKIIQFYNRDYVRSPLWNKRFTQFIQNFNTLRNATNTEIPGHELLLMKFWFYSIETGCTLFYNGNVRSRYEN